MHIAVVGCGHGEIDKIYDVIAKIEERQGIKVSVVLCCGDFQSVRNMTDLRCMACPIKYQHMHDFHRYYSGEKQAPILTLFIGGNHEASNFLQELPYGGWVAPNIFYMGYVGVVKVGNVRIAGLSGIYKGHDYLKGRYERPPYDQGTIRSVYHYRNLDIFRLKQLKQHVDVVLSHDWPKGIHQYGDYDRLLKQKPFFRDEIERNELGSRPLCEIMESLQPSFWFSAHMHVKFAACVSHPDKSPSTTEKEEDKAESVPVSEASASTSSAPEEMKGESRKTTKFLALDKVLPRRQFLQIIEIPSAREEGDVTFQFDPEWLAVLKSTNDLVSVKDKPSYMPGPGYRPRSDFTPTNEEIQEIQSAFDGDLSIKSNFQKTAPAYVEGEQPRRAGPLENPFTKELCSKLGIVDPFSLLVTPEMLGGANTSDSVLDEDYGDEYDRQMDITMNTTSRTDESVSLNPDEISLDLDEDAGEDNDEMSSSSRNDSSLRSSMTRSRLQLPPPKNANGSGESDVSPGFKRSSLVLPPPKNEGSGEDSEAIGLSTTDSSSFFFLDTDGNGEPNIKRRRDVFD